MLGPGTSSRIDRVSPRKCGPCTRHPLLFVTCSTIGAGLIGTNALLMLVLIGFLYERVDMFVDLALAYAMLNFIGVAALAKYFELRQERPS